MNYEEVEKNLVRVDKDIIEKLKLKENSLYKIYAKCSPNNVPHIAFLFVGFKTGAYCYVYCNTYEYPIDLLRMYSISVIFRLCDLGEGI